MCRWLTIYLFILFIFYFKCFLMQVTPALMACGQHVPAARENIHTHKLLQYLLQLSFVSRQFHHFHVLSSSTT